MQLQTARLRTGREDGEWAIGLKDDTCLQYEWRGLVQLDAGESADDVSPEQLEARRLSYAAMDRWGTPVAEPQDGFCSDCEFFVPLSGDDAFNGYGVCTADGGSFDGRVVHRRSGCPLFTAFANEK